MKVFKLIGIIFLVVGITMLSGGIFYYNHTSRWVQNLVKTVGTVVDFERSTSDSRSQGVRWCNSGPKQESSSGLPVVWGVISQHIKPARV